MFFEGLLMYLTSLIGRRDGLIAILAILLIVFPAFVYSYSVFGVLGGLLFLPGTLIWNMGVHLIWGGFTGAAPIIFGVTILIWDLLMLLIEIINTISNFD